MTRESRQAFLGRQRRERADAVDALKLKAGEPIAYAGKFTHFSPLLHNRSGMDYGYIRRLTPAEVVELKTRERNLKSIHEKWEEDQRERAAFEARPDVQAARSIFYSIELRLPEILNNLTVKEWQQFAAALERK